MTNNEAIDFINKHIGELGRARDDLGDVERNASVRQDAASDNRLVTDAHRRAKTAGQAIVAFFP